LRGFCYQLDCTFSHDDAAAAAADHATKEILQALKKRNLCQVGTKCGDSTCFFGHNCPNMWPGTPPKDRTKTSCCAYGGPTSRCRFPAEMHDMDLSVASETS
jgi:hypothetical protein